MLPRFVRPAFAMSLLITAATGCTASSSDPTGEGLDATSNELQAAATSTTTYHCTMVTPIEIILDGQQGRSPVTLTISAAQAKIVGPDTALVASRKSSTSTKTVYEDFKPTDGKTGFFVADVTRLTVDTSMTKGAASGKAAFETITFDDGEPTDPEISPPTAPSTIRNTQRMACSKQ
jgi:hypothetical protein